MSLLDQEPDDIEIKVDPRVDPSAQVLRLVQYPNIKKSLKHRDLIVISVVNLDKISNKDGLNRDGNNRREHNDVKRRFIDIDEPIKKIYMRNI